MRGILAFIAGLLVAVVAAIIIFGWPSYWTWAWPWHPYDRAVTVKNFELARGFNPNRPHAVCSVKLVNEGQSYRLAINRGGACSRTVTVIVPAEKVVKTVNAGRTTATFAYFRHVFFRDYAEDGVMDWRSPNSGGKKSTVAWIKSLSLGELLMVDLRVITLRSPPRV